MPAPPLAYLARKACIRNIRSITDVGDADYRIVRPVLLKLENAEQLHDIELQSPQILGEDAELWREFIKRDIPNSQGIAFEPKNPANWYKVYRKLRKDLEKDVDKDAEDLKKAMDGIKAERAKHTSKVVDPRTMPKLPRMGGMRVEKSGGPAGPRGSSGNAALLTFTSGSKTKTFTGKGVMERARREAREIALFSNRTGSLATPTHQLAAKATQVRSVPKTMINDYRQGPNPTNIPIKVLAPRRKSLHPEMSASTTPRMSGTEGREQRLLALTAVGGSEVDVQLRESSPDSPMLSRDTPPASKAAPAKGPSPNRGPVARKKAPVDIFMPAKRRKVA